MEPKHKKPPAWFNTVCVILGAVILGLVFYDGYNQYGGSGVRLVLRTLINDPAVHIVILITIIGLTIAYRKRSKDKDEP